VPRLEALEDRTALSTLAVTRAGDDVAERGTLRWAVAEAAGGDTILLTGALADSPVVLSHGELLLSQDVTIEAVGQAPVTISGGGAARVFEVAPSAHVSLVNLAITGGNGRAGADGSFTFDGAGGGIANLGTLTVSGSTLSGNHALDGGGIYNTGTLTVSGTTLSGNAASTGGGGIFNVRDATATVSDSTLTGNTAALEGGGIFNSFGTLTVTGSTVSGNTSTSFIGGRGGGILNFGGMLTVSDTTVSGNTADEAGGIVNVFGTATVSGSTVSGNTATSFGGGLFNSFGTLTVTGSTVSGNTAHFGGGIWNFSTGTLNLGTTMFCDNTPDDVAGAFNDLGGNTFC
jgi:hypothetical protein